MGLARDRLKIACPPLHSTLERSWEIALNEWLPALGVQSDSFNSYPHLRNLEIHLDRLMAAAEVLPATRGIQLLSPIECYVLLSSILFHDIGRLHAIQDHGLESAKIIRSKHSALGIESEELANTVARICRFHTVPANKVQEALAQLSTVVIDPYGDIRERGCAALLTLVDHLDSAFTRVLPEYVKSFSQIETVGAFRKAVRGVEVDLTGQLVKVVLGKDIWVEKPNPVPIQLIANPDLIRGATGGMAAGFETHQQFEKSFQSLLKKESKAYGGKNPSLIKAICKKKTAFTQAEWAVARQLVFLERLTPGPIPPWVFRKLDHQKVVCKPLSCDHKKQNAKNQSASPWAHEMLLAVLMGNTRENTEALLSIRSTLTAMGIPIRRWLLEYDEHLFNELGEETCEPIFFIDYLIEVAQNMWKLSTEVFGHNEFSYETLAGQMRETNADKIARAVRRLDILVREDDPNERMQTWVSHDNQPRQSGLWVGQKSWKWEVKQYPSTKSAFAKCKFATIDSVKERIRMLSEPTEGEG
jgi:hypothetical protein